MAYLAVNKDGREIITDNLRNTHRNERGGYWYCGSQIVELPKGTIEKLIGRTLTWDNEPVELEII